VWWEWGLEEHEDASSDNIVGANIQKYSVCVTWEGVDTCWSSKVWVKRAKAFLQICRLHKHLKVARCTSMSTHYSQVWVVHSLLPCMTTHYSQVFSTMVVTLCKAGKHPEFEEDLSSRLRLTQGCHLWRWWLWWWWLPTQAAIIIIKITVVLLGQKLPPYIMLPPSTSTSLSPTPALL